MTWIMKYIWKHFISAGARLVPASVWAGLAEGRELSIYLVAVTLDVGVKQIVSSMLTAPQGTCHCH